MQIFDEHMPAPNQLGVTREDVHVTAADLLQVPVVSVASMTYDLPRTRA